MDPLYEKPHYQQMRIKLVFIAVLVIMLWVLWKLQLKYSKVLLIAADILQHFDLIRVQVLYEQFTGVIET